LRILGFLLAWLTTSLAAAQNIEGDWYAALEVQNDAPLRLALHVTRASSGMLEAKLDSIDEAGSALPVDSFTVTGAAVKFEMKDACGFFNGRIAPDGTTIGGHWTQNGETLPLNWERGEDPALAAHALDSEQAREKGRTYTEWFYGGRLSDLWMKLSPVMQQAMVTADSLRELRAKVEEQFGLETKVVEETVKPDGILQVYHRLAKFNKASSDIDLQFVFNPRAMVAGFTVRRAVE